jgi:hypothetical protein
MVASGWAATFVIYPSIPSAADLNLMIEEAGRAWTRRDGAWTQFGEDLLLGYEYRACIKLGVKNLTNPARTIGEAYQRVCVDLQTMTETGLHDYFRIPPHLRLWIWQTDLEQARKNLPINH